MNENINETEEWENISNDIVENIIDDTNTVQNETTSNTVIDESNITIETIHDDLVFIGSFLIFFTIYLLIKTTFKFFDMFF